LSRRRLPLPFQRVALFGLGLNAAWEFLQCTVFYDMWDWPFWRAALWMWGAILGDVLIVLGVVSLAGRLVGPKVGGKERRAVPGPVPVRAAVFWANHASVRAGRPTGHREGWLQGHTADEIEEMYPQFIREAEAEERTDAANLCSWRRCSPFVVRRICQDDSSRACDAVRPG